MAHTFYVYIENDYTEKRLWPAWDKAIATFKPTETFTDIIDYTGHTTFRDHAGLEENEEGACKVLVAKFDAAKRAAAFLAAVQTEADIAHVLRAGLVCA